MQTHLNGISTLQFMLSLHRKTNIMQNMTNKITFWLVKSLIVEPVWNKIIVWHICWVKQISILWHTLFRIHCYEAEPLKGTQDWEFFWLRFWNLRYFFVSYVKILRLYKKKNFIGPLMGEVRFFRVVLGLRGMKKNFELGQKKKFFLLQLWTLNMTQY